MTHRPKKPRTPKAQPTGPETARGVALDVLLRVRDPTQPGLADCLAESNLEARDLGLAREIAFGVSRLYRWLEASLPRALRDYRHPKKRATRMAMACAVYQYAYLDRIPPHAIVSETVDLIKLRDHNPRIAGWANSVLRQMTKTPPERFRPLEDTPWPLRYSVPESLQPYIASVLPEEADQEAFWRSVQDPAPLVFRARGDNAADLLEPLTMEIGDRGTVRRSRWLPDAFVVEGALGLSPADLELFREGKITVEDEGAQLAVTLATMADVRGRVLDLCAAPGGKTAHLLDHAESGTVLTATDVSETKLDRLRETLTRLGLENRPGLGLAEDVLTESADGAFHLVLIDAPCSGLGSMRRHPEIKDRRTPDDIAQLSRTQASLLEKAARLVEPGGLMAYTVCTVTRDEGEKVVRGFLGAHSDFFLEAPSADALPFDPEPFRCDSGLYRTWTHRDGCDAFTIARLRRRA